MNNEVNSGDESRHSRYLPATKLGRAAVKLLLALLVVFAAANVIALLPGGDDFVDSSKLYRFVAGLAFAAAGAGAMSTGAIALFRDHDRAVLTWLAWIVGLLAVAFVLSDAISS